MVSTARAMALRTRPTARTARASSRFMRRAMAAGSMRSSAALARLRRSVASRSYRGVRAMPHASYAGSRSMSATIGIVSVETGLDVLVRRRGSLLHGRRFGLVAHQASVDSRHEHAAMLLADLPRARLVRLFAPEHGLWGAAQDHAPIAGTRDPVTGVPVVSLYGERR